MINKMIDQTKSPFDIRKLEFWAATVLYVLSIFLLVSDASRHSDGSNFYNRAVFEENHIPFSYYSNYLVPVFFRNTTFYVSFLLLIFQVVPALVQKRNLALNIFVTVLIFTGIGLVFGITDTWLKGYLYGEYRDWKVVYDMLFKANFIYALWLMIIFGIYTAMKYLALYLLKNSDRIQAKYQTITREVIIAFILWMVTFFLMMIGDVPREILALYGVIIPTAIGVYWYSISMLIPEVQPKRRKFLMYLLKLVLVIAVITIPISIVLMIFFNRGETIGIVDMFNAAFQVFITAPLSWFIYNQKKANTSELTTLKTALGHSSANLTLLRSQINPHFLFNALNTLYGTALQENAERTSEGIQRLGDMMRFMLEENMQDKITLNREIDYIKNYISLQKLRTQSSPDILIQTAITEQVNSLSITPMLLIPFIENAFKHGISLREPSHIKVSLQIDKNVLYFDVYNSIHHRAADDPEKDKSGIGLNNVRQRLKLSYPEKHELIIRENAKEFFVHLTIQLSS